MKEAVLTAFPRAKRIGSVALKSVILTVMVLKGIIFKCESQINTHFPCC
jgi:hypothetical protein